MNSKIYYAEVALATILNITINGKNVILNSGVLINKSEVMINITP